DSGASAILVLENFAHVVEAVLPRTKIKHVLVTAAGDFLSFPKSWIVNFGVRHVRKQVRRWKMDGAINFKAALAKGRQSRFTPVDIDPQDIAFLQYTGGTTGVAKGAMLTHRNICANVLQAEAWVGHSFDNAPSTLIT